MIGNLIDIVMSVWPELGLDCFKNPGKIALQRRHLYQTSPSGDGGGLTSNIYNSIIQERRQFSTEAGALCIQCQYE